MCFLTNEDDNYWGISAKEDDNIRKEVERKEEAITELAEENRLDENSFL
jgi:hypothetical protein